jgi:23S rRNA (uracil1939-C5)-methyltransferase
VAAGRGFVWKTVGELRYRISHQVFFQVNDTLLLELVAAATHGYSGRRALDLYCGAGFFTLPLSKTFERVTAVEVNRVALSDLAQTLQTNQVSNVQLLEWDVRDLLTDRSSAIESPDFLLVDPPRTGLLGQSVRDIASLGARELVYVSCDPSTLARDLRILRTCAYVIGSVDLLDLFPATHHMETVVHMKKD